MYTNEIKFKLSSETCNSLTPEDAINGAYSTLAPVIVSQVVMRPNYEIIKLNKKSKKINRNNK